MLNDIKDRGDTDPLSSFFLGGNKGVTRSLNLSFIAIFDDDGKEGVGRGRYLYIDKAVFRLHPCAGFGGIFQKIGDDGAQVYIRTKRFLGEGDLDVKG